MYQVANNANPEAFITRKKSRAKIYQHNNLYFNDGETFEIELFNPKTNRVLAKIWLNGEEITGSGIIVNPGQRIFLERFIDSNNRFVYKTYDVDGTNESLTAIRNNGNVEVRFYDEYFTNLPINNYWYSNSSPTIFHVGTTARGFCGSTVTTTSGSLNNSSSVAISNTNVFGSLNMNSKSVETGRVEKGESTNQSFETSYGSFFFNSTNEFKYKILPISAKPIEGKDIKRYCTECGKKVKESFKFCPSCGNKI